MCFVFNNFFTFTFFLLDYKILCLTYYSHYSVFFLFKVLFPPKYSLHIPIPKYYFLAAQCITFVDLQKISVNLLEFFFYCNWAFQLKFLQCFILRSFELKSSKLFILFPFIILSKTMQLWSKNYVALKNFNSKIKLLNIYKFHNHLNIKHFNLIQHLNFCQNCINLNKTFPSLFS